MKRKFHVRCEGGEKTEITSNSYLFLFPRSVDTLLKIAYIKTLCKQLKIEKIRQVKDEILLIPATKYKTKEKIGYKIVDELEILLENMCTIKK